MKRLNIRSKSRSINANYQVVEKFSNYKLFTSTFLQDSVLKH